MPDLIGMYWADAEPALRASGWVGALVKGPDVTNSDYERNQIATQDPTPGQLIHVDQTITLQFAL